MDAVTHARASTSIQQKDLPAEAKSVVETGFVWIFSAVTFSAQFVRGEAEIISSLRDFILLLFLYQSDAPFSLKLISV